MALTLDFKAQAFGQDIILKDSYVRVNSVYWDKHQTTGNVDVCDSITKATLKTVAYSFASTMDGGNFVKQTYEFLKTLPEFADAIDC
jgi:hypothetical protein